MSYPKIFKTKQNRTKIPKEIKFKLVHGSGIKPYLPSQEGGHGQTFYS